MKKVFLFSSVLLLFLVAINPLNSSAQKLEAKIIDTSSYKLAYPGILPDNPFYKLKVLRDKITVWLISDPVRKIDFYLLQADKGVAATELLIKNKKIDLAKDTGFKAENNYTLLTYVVKANKLSVTKKEFEKLYDAAKKHQEVLESIIASTSGDQQKAFQTMLYFSQQNVNEIKNTQEILDQQTP